METIDTKKNDKSVMSLSKTRTEWDRTDVSLWLKEDL